MQTLTELRLKLTNLQSTIDRVGNQQTEMQTEIDECVEFLDLITGGGLSIGAPVGRPKKAKTKIKTNGSAGKVMTADSFRKQVRTHYTARRKKSTKKKPGTTRSFEEALEIGRRKYPGVPDPSPDTVTTHEAAGILKMSDSGVRLLYGSNLPESSKELRRFGRSGRFHPATVVPRSAIEAYAQGRTRKQAQAANSKRPPSNSGYSVMAKARRERSFNLLAQFDRAEARPVPAEFSAQGVSVLVQHGYLKTKGDGYLRTAKEFRV